MAERLGIRWSDRHQRKASPPVDGFCERSLIKKCSIEKGSAYSHLGSQRFVEIPSVSTVEDEYKIRAGCEGI
jgi:hypothetical protein